MKKTRRPAAEASFRPPLPPAYPEVGEDARAWFKLRNLAQDYDELLKDMAAKRRRLKIAKQRALTLTDEVRFLRRRRKFLLKNGSPAPYQVKTHSQRTQNAPPKQRGKNKKSPAATNAVRRSQDLPSQLSRQGGSYRKEKGAAAAAAALPSTAFATLDLNQVSMPDGEEEADFQHGWGSSLPLSAETPGRYPPEGASPGADLKVSGCRDARGGSSRAGKRKVSWQDQVALKV